MSNQAITPKAPEKNILEDVENPQHRVDVMGYRLVEKLAGASTDPVVGILWSNLKNPLADFLNQTFGPEPARVKPKATKAPRKRKRRTRKPVEPHVRLNRRAGI